MPRDWASLAQLGGAGRLHRCLKTSGKLQQIWAVSFPLPEAITCEVEWRPELTIGEGFPTVLDAAKKREPWAFARLYSDLSPPVAGYLRVQGAAEPEDVTSDVFLGVFTGLGSFDGSETQFRSWVFTIAHRKLIDERRRLARRRWSPAGNLETLDHTGGDVEADAFEVLGSQRVLEWCAHLSADQRDVVVLRIIGDLTVEQVALIVGKSSGAVKALQRRALSSLRHQLEKEGVTL
jgi:RNA polymerase sigma factor (sigma-70 family)